jgi:acetyl esterase
MHAMTPMQARAFYEASADVLEPPPHKLQRVEDVQVPVRDGASLNARLYAVDHGRHPVLLFFHGGGFTIGSVATHDALCRSLCHLSQCSVLSLDYRLAPEYRFPTAVNDCWDALQWLQHHGSALGVDTRRMAVGGDSAGGTLAAVCAVLARDAGLTLALQLLFYPGTAAHQDCPSHKRFAHGFLLEREHIAWMFGHYLANDAERADWRFAPLDGCTEQGHPVDLDRVAPVWMGLAECDPLLDEGLAYADRLRMAGVPVDLEQYRGVVHEFIRMGRAIAQARLALADAARALRNAVTTG